MTRVAVMLVIGCVLFTRPLVPVYGQGKVVLHLKLTPGEALGYAVTRRELTSLVGPNGQTTRTTTLEALEVHRVLERDPTGAVTVEIFQESAKVTREGKTEDTWRIPLTLQVSQFGVVLTRVSGVYSKPEEFPVPLPDAQIGVGDTWRRQRTLEGVGMDGRVTRLFTLVNLDRRANETVAQVQLREEAALTVRPGSSSIPGVQAIGSGKLEGSGEISWSVERGRILRASTQTVTEVQADVRSQGQLIRVTVTTRTTEERELLPQLPIGPVPGVEELIVPGKNLGKLAFGVTLQELVGQFGQPAEEPDLGLASRRLRWANGLVIYVSAEDSGSILALEITEARYRTEKGIGYQSSQGAVLIAYGLDPKKTELSSVRLGGYRALVYDGLGIAFGIRADNFGTLLGRKHPPLDTVEFVVIFPAGTASKVFGP